MYWISRRWNWVVVLAMKVLAAMIWDYTKRNRDLTRSVKSEIKYLEVLCG